MTQKEANDAMKKEILNEFQFNNFNYKSSNFGYKRAIVEKK